MEHKSQANTDGTPAAKTAKAKICLFFIFKSQSCENAQRRSQLLKGKTSPAPAMPRTLTTIESGEETARRRQRRLGRTRICKRVLQRQHFKLRGRKQIQFSRGGREFYFQRPREGFGFLFGLFGGGNMTGPLWAPAVNGVQSPVAGSSQTTLQA